MSANEILDTGYDNEVEVLKLKDKVQQLEEENHNLKNKIKYKDTVIEKKKLKVLEYQNIIKLQNMKRKRMGVLPVSIRDYQKMNQKK